MGGRQTSTDVCPNCSGKGWYTLDVDPGHELFGRRLPCHCLLTRTVERTRRMLAGDSGLDHLADKTFESFRILEGNRRAYQAALAFARHPSGFLLLVGGCGRGKTHLLAAIGNELLRRGVDVVYANGPRLLQRLKRTFDERNLDLTFDQRFRGLEEVQVLLLDDLGAENPTPWAQEIFFQLLDARLVAHRPTAIASNLRRESFGPRLSSRLYEARYIILSGPDYRKLLAREKEKLEEDLERWNL